MSLLVMPPRPTGESWVHPFVDVHAFDELSDQRQTGVGGEVVGQLFDKKVAI